MSVFDMYISVVSTIACRCSKQRACCNWREMYDRTVPLTSGAALSASKLKLSQACPVGTEDVQVLTHRAPPWIWHQCRSDPGPPPQCFHHKNMASFFSPSILSRLLVNNSPLVEKVLVNSKLEILFIYTRKFSMFGTIADLLRKYCVSRAVF